MANASLNGLSDALRQYQDKKIKQVKDLVIDSITTVELLATRSLTANSTAELNLNFINIDKKFSNGGLTGEVGVMGDNDLAAYLEFGTGKSAREILAPYPQWVQDIAMKFFKTGDGTLKGKPYLFNNFLVIWQHFIDELDKIMKN